MNGEMITKAVRAVTDDWRKHRTREERGRPEVTARRKTAMRSSGYEYSTKVLVKEAAWECMEDAYMKASGGGKRPANVRQIMYAARPYILAHAHDRYGDPLPFDDDNFTQKLLPDYIKEHGHEEDWDVAYDARGHLAEPHTRKIVPLGTLDVRNYLHEMACGGGNLAIPKIDDSYPTCGPENRFGAVLFIEKEGFLPLFEAVGLERRYDIAIMSTKGQTVVAARKLAENMCSDYSVPLYVLRDFDKAGFAIASSFQKNNRRYTFTRSFGIVDLGLRLKDVNEWDLISEDVYYRSDPRANLEENGATPEEIAFLCEGGHGKRYYGRRVELNAFTSDNLVAWIESKLREHGVKKIVPETEVLKDAYAHAVKVAFINNAIEEAREGAEKAAEDNTPPSSLQKEIKAMLEDAPTQSWDEALAAIARTELQKGNSST